MGGEGPSRGDQSLVSPEITTTPPTPTPAIPASTTAYYVPTITSKTRTPWQTWDILYHHKIGINIFS